MATSQELAQSILDAVGGPANVSFCTHCMTRLRFVLKDFSLADTDRIESMKGVVGCLESAGQLQIIVGTTVDKVYDAVCDLGGFEKEAPASDPAAAGEGEKRLTPKQVMDNVLNTLSGCLTPLLPVIIGAGLVRMLPTLFGPTMLGLLSEQDSTYRILNIVGDAAFYYLPIFMAITASQKFNCSMVLSVLFAAVLLHPDFLQVATDGEPFSVYGIPMKLTTYSNTIVPTLLATWVFSYVERGLKRVVPDVLRSIAIPALSILIMLPLELCLIGPIGAVIGDGIGASVTTLRSGLGFLGVGLLSATYLLLVATGMHLALSAVAITIFTSQGTENMVFVALPIAMFVCMGLAAGVFLRGRDAETKELGLSCLLAQALGGVSEPTIYGIILRHRWTILYTVIGGFAGGVWAGITDVTFNNFTSTNILIPMCYIGSTSNLVNGCISIGLGFAVTLALTLVLGIDGPRAAQDKPADAKEA